ncbi:hypothetical protein N3S92_004258 [Cronobacter sakazakii]|nr:hypothetical protein [Cronobacter sakazakii]
MTGLELIQNYKEKTVMANKAIQQLQFQIDDINYELEDSRPDLSKHIAEQKEVVKQKGEAFWKALSEIIMEPDFVNAYQMESIVAFSQVLPHASSAMTFVSDEGGAACVAYCLNGKLKRDALKYILPGEWRMGAETTATNENLLQHRLPEITRMCETLGICAEQLGELKKESDLLKILESF